MATPASVGNLKGTGYKQLSINRFNPEQQQLFSQAAGALSPHLADAISSLGGLAGGREGTFDQLEAPALRQFAGLQGQLASRFSGMGSGARRSSGFNLASGDQAADFAERLQAQRMGLQQNAIQQLMGLYGNLIGTQQYETGFLPKEKPWWQELLGSLSGGVGQGLGVAGSLFGAKKFGLLG